MRNSIEGGRIWEVGHEYLVPTEAYSAYEGAIRDILQENLEDLQVDIKISDEIERATTESFAKPLVAGVGINDILVSMLIGANSPDAKNQFILITPDIAGFALYRDSDANLWTDMFYTFEEGTIKKYWADEYMPIADIVTQFSEVEEDWIPEGQRNFTKKLREITENKYLTKQILQDKGVPTPRGIYISQNEPVKKSLEGYLSLLPDIDPFVIKSNSDSGGKNVKMFDQMATLSMEQAEEFFSEMLGMEKDILIEERITPPQVSTLGSQNQWIDHNYRILVAARSEPQIIDSEIRYGDYGQDPINIHLGAKAARLDGVISQEQQEKVYATAIDSVNALLESVPGESGVDLVGVDIITDYDGSPYVIELNSGIPGGFGTLTRLDKKPLDSTRSFIDLYYKQPKDIPALEGDIEFYESDIKVAYDAKVVDHLFKKIKDKELEQVTKYLRKNNSHPLFLLLELHSCLAQNPGRVREVIDDFYKSETFNDSQSVEVMCSMLAENGKWSILAETISKYLYAGNVYSPALLTTHVLLTRNAMFSTFNEAEHFFAPYKYKMGVENFNTAMEDAKERWESMDQNVLYKISDVT